VENNHTHIHNRPDTLLNQINFFLLFCCFIFLVAFEFDPGL